MQPTNPRADWPQVFQPRKHPSARTERRWRHPGEHGEAQTHDLVYGIVRDVDGGEVIERAWVHDTAQRCAWLYETVDAGRDAVRERINADTRWREVAATVPAPRRRASILDGLRLPPGSVIIGRR